MNVRELTRAQNRTAAAPTRCAPERRKCWSRRTAGLLSVPLSCFALLLYAAQTRADVLVDHPLSSASSGAFSNLGPANQQKASTFVLAAPAAVDSVSWSGRYFDRVSPANPVDFSIRFFADDGGVPAVSPLQVFTVSVAAADTGLAFGTVPWYSYASSIPALNLDAGVTYWFSILENDARTTPVGSSQWMWGHSATDGPEADRGSDGETWSPQRGLPDFAFQLSGTTTVTPTAPEPASLCLLALSGLPLAGAVVRRNRLPLLPTNRRRA